MDPAAERVRVREEGRRRATPTCGRGGEEANCEAVAGLAGGFLALLAFRFAGGAD